MGFSKKDLGDVVWNSETGRDPVFLTSRPKDIDYPQLLSIQTLDRRTTWATLFQMERRPFIRSGLVQAETAYRRTNTNLSRSEMQTNPIQDTPSPDPNSELQRKSAFIRAARRYAEEQSWLIQQDPRHTVKQYRLAIKNLLVEASHLTEPRKPRSTDKPETPKPATAHLINAGQRYRMNPSIVACERLLAMAINWYSAEGRQDPTETGATSETRRPTADYTAK